MGDIIKIDKHTGYKPTEGFQFAPHDAIEMYLRKKKECREKDVRIDALMGENIELREYCFTLIEHFDSLAKKWKKVEKCLGGSVDVTV